MHPSSEKWSCNFRVFKPIWFQQILETFGSCLFNFCLVKWVVILQDWAKYCKKIVQLCSTLLVVCFLFEYIHHSLHTANTYMLSKCILVWFGWLLDQVMYSLMSIRQNYNFNMLAMIWHETCLLISENLPRFEKVCCTGTHKAM